MSGESKVLTWEEIIRESERLNGLAFRSSIKNLPDDTVIDENQSVKWNREQVAANNAEYYQAFEDYRQERKSQYDNLQKMIYQRILQDLPRLNEDIAGEIWQYAQNISLDSAMSDFVDSAVDLIDLIKKVVELVQKGE